jgi:hypothetical protein
VDAWNNAGDFEELLLCRRLPYALHRPNGTVPAGSMTKLRPVRGLRFVDAFFGLPCPHGLAGFAVIGRGLTRPVRHSANPLKPALSLLRSGFRLW